MAKLKVLEQQINWSRDESFGPAAAQVSVKSHLEAKVSKVEASFGHSLAQVSVKESAITQLNGSFRLAAPQVTLCIL